MFRPRHLRRSPGKCLQTMTNIESIGMASRFPATLRFGGYKEVLVRFSCILKFIFPNRSELKSITSKCYRSGWVRSVYELKTRM
jgi:hypothetical protein